MALRSCCTLAALLALAFSLFAQPVRAAIRDGGIDPANMGRGSWIYILPTAISGQGVTLGAAPSGLDLAETGKAELSVPLSAPDAEGTASLRVALTTPDGRQLLKTLTIPVQANDPEIARQSRFDLAVGASFTLDENVFAGLLPGSGRATLAAGPLARFDAPGLLAALDAYPYGCTEQLASKALPLLYFDQVATAMGAAGGSDVRKRVDETIAGILLNQSPNGAFGLWYPDAGDLWIDAYVTDFLSRAKAQGYAVPDTAFRNALNNLRNQVNYAPDFDEGGGPYAYALMVLARDEHEGQDVRIPFDAVLVAVGRVANLKGFGLEELSIPTGRTVDTNEFLQTNYPNIYAAGDVAGPFQFTHTAAHQAWYAAVNALFDPFKKFKADYSVIPWATFVEPEVARVGLNELEAKEKGISYEVTTYGIDDLDRAIADSEAHGFLKVLTVPGKDKILGVTIVGEHAGDLIAEYVLAMKQGIGLNKNVAGGEDMDIDSRGVGVDR